MAKAKAKERNQTKALIVCACWQTAVVLFHLIIHYLAVAFEWDYSLQGILSCFGTFVLSFVAIAAFNLSFLAIAASEFIFFALAYVVLNQNVVVLFFVINYDGASSTAPFSNPLNILIIKIVMDAVIYLFSKWINWDEE